MDLLEAIHNRRSVRAFTDEQVSREVLSQVLSDASRAPSAINMQPWEVHVVRGEERKRLSQRLLRSLSERQLTCGPGTAKPLPERFMLRGRECAQIMTPLIERMGSDFKTFVNQGSLDFYGAPAACLIFIDESFQHERMTDIGSFLAYLVLAAAARGLGTCPIGLVCAYADDVKDHLNIPESKNLVISVAIGRPDPEAAINEFRAPRAELKEFVRWID